MFSVLNTAGKLITRIEDAYKLWYKIWNVDYISLIRECIKLMNIEDTSLLDDIKTVQKASQQLLDEDQVVPQHLLDKAIDDDIPTDEMQFNKTTEYFDEEDTTPKKTITTEKPKKERKKKKTELENLKIDNWEPPCRAKRTRKISSLVNSTSACHCLPLIIGLELKYNKQEEVGVGNEDNFVEGEVLNENNPVLLM